MRTPSVPLVLLVLSLIRSSSAFSVLPNSLTPTSIPNPRSSLFRLFALPEIKDMKLKDMRVELESYGISTRTFLEKKEFLDALNKARDEGMTPVNGAAKEPENAGSSSQASSSNYADAYSYYNQQKASESKTNSNAQAQANGSTQAKQQTQTTSASRAERIHKETEKAKSMRVSELKQKLKDMGVSTKSFFEKTEFVRAYAEAVVDGVSRSQKQQKEDYDPEYRDVVMQKFDPDSQQRYLLGGTIIDIKV